MTLTIRKEDTGKDNYVHASVCPIACALKDAGYHSVQGGPHKWSGWKFKFGFIPWYYSGRIPKETNIIAQHVSMYKQDKDTIIELNQ